MKKFGEMYKLLINSKIFPKKMESVILISSGGAGGKGGPRTTILLVFTFFFSCFLKTGKSILLLTVKFQHN